MRRLSVVLFFLAAACGQSAGSGGSGASLTYWHDVKPLFAQHCEGCHNATGIGPFDLTTFASAKAQAGAISAAVKSGTMPPWMPSVDSPPIQHTRRLEQKEIDTIVNWVSQGAAEGDAKTYVAPASGDLATIEDDAELQMKNDYQPDLSLGTDDYRCFVLDSNLQADTAVVGFDIKPGNRRIVHHVILFAVDPSPAGTPAAQDNFTQLQKLEDEDPKEGYTCFGDARLDSEYMVGAWVPGSTATPFPQGTGVVLGKGAKLIMQVHYNMLEVQHATDRTTAVLDYAAASSVSQAYILPFLNDTFSVAPGEVKTITSQFTLKDLYDAYGIPTFVKLNVWGTAPHMHVHGTQISVNRTDATGKTAPMIAIPKWDFHWQQMYFYEDAITPDLTDQITLSCTFDNRQSAQPYVNGQQEEAQTLTWGEGTLQEMCLAFFYITAG